jgi:hypothetical protein
MKVLILISAVALSVQGHAQMFAADFTEKLTARPTSGATQCPDFSGNWKGTCKLNVGEPYAYQTVVKQIGCDSIYANDNFYAIGGQRSEGHLIPKADGDLTSMAITHLNWDANWDAPRSALVSKTDVAVTKAGVGLIYTDVVYGSTSLVNGRLITYAKGQNFESHCEFMK